MVRTKYKALAWAASGGGTIACTEKIKVLDENLREIKHMMQEALDDAVLMGCDAHAVRQRFSQLALDLESTFS